MDDTESHRFYNKILIGIRNLRNANIVNNIKQLHSNLTLENISSEVRGLMFYNILVYLAQFVDFEFQEVYSMHMIHTIIHENILGLGMNRYLELMTPLLNKFPFKTSKVIMASPYLEGSYDLFEKINSTLTMYVKLSCLQMEYSEQLDGELMLALGKNLQILSEYSKVTKHRNAIYDTFKQIGVCTNDANADDIAFVVENGVNFSEDMRKIYVFIHELKKKNYKITLFHSTNQLYTEPYTDLFYNILYINPLFNNHYAKNVAERRYRAVFYTNTNIWSMYLAYAGLGFDQYYIGTATTKLPNIRKFLPYFGVTQIKTKVDKCSRSENVTKPIIFCPWTVSELMNNVDQLTQLSKLDVYIHLFCLDGPFELNRFKTFSIDAPNVIIGGEKTDIYYKSMKISDYIVCGSYNVAVDALYDDKKIICINDTPAKEVLDLFCSDIKYVSDFCNSEEFNHVKNADKKIEKYNDLVREKIKDFCQEVGIDDRTNVNPE